MKDFGGVLRLAVLLWAILCVYCLGREEPIPVEEPVVEDISVIEVADEQIEEVDDQIDFSKLNQIENATLTHYCICKSCCGKDESHPAYGITASGREAEPYLSVAVDPLMIPLGSKVYIDYGDGEISEYRADDTGNFGGAKIDLCVTGHQEALELGVKTVKVWWE